MTINVKWYGSQKYLLWAKECLSKWRYNLTVGVRLREYTNSIANSFSSSVSAKKQIHCTGKVHGPYKPRYQTSRQLAPASCTGLVLLYLGMSLKQTIPVLKHDSQCQSIFASLIEDDDACFRQTITVTSFEHSVKLAPQRSLSLRVYCYKATMNVTDWGCRVGSKFLAM